MGHILVIDLGTTTVKTFIIDLEGEILAKNVANYESIVSAAGMYEQDPRIWLIKIKEGVKQVIEKTEKVEKKDIEAITIVSQRATVFPVDRSGEPLYNALTWMDNRKPEINEEKKKLYNHRVTIDKILWFKQYKPEIYKEAEKFLLPDSFLTLYLTGEPVSSPSQGIYALYDPLSGKYEEEKLEELGIEVEKLPTVMDSDKVIGTLKSEVADELGLSTETSVVVGSGDQQASALGLGMLEKNDAKLTLGTGAFVDVVTEEYQFDYYEEATRIFNLPHAVKGKWLIEAVIPGAGTLLDWFINNFAYEEYKKAKTLKITPYSIMDDLASEVSPTTDNLIIVPLFIFGKGSIKNISFIHTRSHIYRGILEGVGYSVRFFVDLIENLDFAIETLRMDGGGANSKIWPKIIADITGKMVAITKPRTDASAIGALILGGKALGYFSSYQSAIDKVVRVSKIIEPDEELSEKYQEIYEQFIDELLSAAQEIEV